MASDATVAIFIGIILFLVPSDIPGLTQDPGKNLDWDREGPLDSPCLPAWNVPSTTLDRNSQSPERLDDLSRGQGLRDKVRVLQN